MISKTMHKAQKLRFGKIKKRLGAVRTAGEDMIGMTVEGVCVNKDVECSRSNYWCFCGKGALISMYLKGGYPIWGYSSELARLV